MSKELITRGFRQMMTLAAIGASGKKMDIADIDWCVVLCYAQEQASLSLVSVALLECPAIECPEQLREQLLGTLRNATEKEFIRKMRILHMLEETKALGIDAKLVKGYPIADCYAFPESRSSSDTDILVPLEQEGWMCEYLRSKGFRVDLRGKTGHHDVAQHPKLGVVEVHVHLYNELRRKIWFHAAEDDILLKEAFVQATTSDTSYTTLGYTDHLIFLTLHMVEHFICTGMGLRMMLDIALFFSKHKEQINVQRYWSIMESLKYTTLVSSILWALIDTGCFDQNDFPGMPGNRPEGIELLLNDLQQGGHMGIKGKHQYDGAYEYSRQVMLRTKSPMQYRLYMLRQKIRDAEKQMFPEKEHLVKLYPVLLTKSWLTPLVRIYRIFAYPIQKIREGALKDQIRSESSDMPEEAKRRLEMFKVLNMI